MVECIQVKNEPGYSRDGASSPIGGMPRSAAGQFLWGEIKTTSGAPAMISMGGLIRSFNGISPLHPV